MRVLRWNLQPDALRLQGDLVDASERALGRFGIEHLVALAVEQRERNVEVSADVVVAHVDIRALRCDQSLVGEEFRHLLEHRNAAEAEIMVQVPVRPVHVFVQIERPDDSRYAIAGCNVAAQLVRIRYVMAALGFACAVRGIFDRHWQRGEQAIHQRFPQLCLVVGVQPDAVGAQGVGIEGGERSAVLAVEAADDERRYLGQYGCPDLGLSDSLAIARMAQLAGKQGHCKARRAHAVTESQQLPPVGRCEHLVNRAWQVITGGIIQRAFMAGGRAGGGRPGGGGAHDQRSLAAPPPPPPPPQNTRVYRPPFSAPPGRAAKGLVRRARGPAPPPTAGGGGQRGPPPAGGFGGGSGARGGRGGRGAPPPQISLGPPPPPKPPPKMPAEYCPPLCPATR